MRRCAFLTMESLDGFVSDDELLLGPLSDRGWDVEMVPWRRPDVEWGRYDAVLVRTTWDYVEAPRRFLRTLQAIERSPALLYNPLELVRWNLEKTYLRDLEARGVEVVPTVWGRKLTRKAIRRIHRELDTEEVVVKPTIGANASRLHRLGPGSGPRAADRAVRALGDRAYLAQPFMPRVVEEGEHSLFYFAGDHSHSVLKTPRGRDFRVQEEHGGRIRPTDAGPELLEAGADAIAAVDPTPLYARVDLVRRRAGGFALMELELVEPALYFRMDAGAPERFVRAFRQTVEGRTADAGAREEGAG